MNHTGNKIIMANNIKKYLALNHKTQIELCQDLHIKPSTFSDWVNAKTYPRIDKIELMAKYFGIKKSDLVEDSSSATPVTALLKFYTSQTPNTKYECVTGDGGAGSIYLISQEKSQKYTFTYEELLSIANQTHRFLSLTLREWDLKRKKDALMPIAAHHDNLSEEELELLRKDIDEL